VYILTRGLDPVLVYDCNGSFIRCWGREFASWPHGLCITPAGFLLSADGNHTVKKFTPEGKLVMILGERNKPSNTGWVDKDYRTIKQAAGPFNYPSDVALDDEQNIYVSDGYGNCKVHVFSKKVEFIRSWGNQEEGRDSSTYPTLYSSMTV